MLIDCDGCAMRGLACSDCVVTVLLGTGEPELGTDEQEAIGVLADAGLVPPLRLVVSERTSPPNVHRHLHKDEENAAGGFAGGLSAG